MILLERGTYSWNQKYLSNSQMSVKPFVRPSKFFKDESSFSKPTTHSSQPQTKKTKDKLSLDQFQKFAPTTTTTTASVSSVAPTTTTTTTTTQRISSWQERENKKIALDNFLAQEAEKQKIKDEQDALERKIKEERDEQEASERRIKQEQEEQEASKQRIKEAKELRKKYETMLMENIRISQLNPSVSARQLDIVLREGKKRVFEFKSFGTDCWICGGYAVTKSKIRTIFCLSCVESMRQGFSCCLSECRPHPKTWYWDDFSYDRAGHEEMGDVKDGKLVPMMFYVKQCRVLFFLPVCDYSIGMQNEHHAKTCDCFSLKWTIPVNVSTEPFSSKFVNIYMGSNDTVLMLKEKIKTAHGTPIDMQELSSGNKQLEDHTRSIRSYGLFNNKIVHLWVRAKEKEKEPSPSSSSASTTTTTSTTAVVEKSNRFAQLETSDDENDEEKSDSPTKKTPEKTWKTCNYEAQMKQLEQYRLEILTWLQISDFKKFELVSKSKRAFFYNSLRSRGYGDHKGISPKFLLL